jgi:4-amino-4-deoxy-L-arabinose transferase-like glycosyltransferase
MHIIIVLLGLALLFGLLFRNKGDSFLDTLQSGCGVLVFIAVALSLLIYFNSK